MCLHLQNDKQAKKLAFKYGSVSLGVINHWYIYIHFMLMLTKIETLSLINSQA